MEIGEPRVTGLRDLDWPVVRAARARVNAWYRQFPDEDGKFLDRLRSENDADFWVAIDELFTHQLLSLNHRDIRYEEDEGAPDFRVYESGELVLSVEVLSLFQESEAAASWARGARLMEGLNQRMTAVEGWALSLHLPEASRDLPVTKLARCLNESLAAAVGQRARRPPTEIIVEQDDWRVVAGLVPFESQSLVGPVVALQGAGIPVDFATRLKRQLKKKASKYDLGERPFMIAVSLREPFSRVADGVPAVLGAQGLFQADSTHPTGCFRGVSAVGLLADFAPWAKTEEYQFLVVDHPDPFHPWPNPGSLRGSTWDSGPAQQVRLQWSANRESSGDQ